MNKKTEHDKLTIKRETGDERALHVRTDVRAGGRTVNHNERQAIRVRTGVRGGAVTYNNNERQGIRVRTGVRGGAVTYNHNERQGIRVRTVSAPVAGTSTTTSGL